MQRRGFLLGLMAAASLGLPAWAGYADDVVAQLTLQGYQDITMTRTWLGRVRILAFRDGGTREIVLNPRTGEILRDLWTAMDGSTRTVSIVDDVRSGGGGSGSGKGSGSGSGSGDGSGDGSGSGSDGGSDGGGSDDGGSGGSGDGGSTDGGSGGGSTDGGSGGGSTDGGTGGGTDDGSSGGGSTDGGSTDGGSSGGSEEGGSGSDLLKNLLGEDRGDKRDEDKRDEVKRDR